MTSKLDEIQARADAAQAAIAGGLTVPLIPLVASLKASHADIGRALAALRAVEAVHEPILALDYGVRDAPLKRQVCTGCGQDDGNWQIWPCPTIRAIREALGS